jgi:sugar phosphate isomerase/epimerase
MCYEHVTVDRRKFIKGLAATAAAVTAGAGMLASSAPSAFADGIAGRTLPNSKIGLQLYSVRNAFMSAPEAVIAKLAAAGYRKVELAGIPGGTDPAHAPALRALFDQYGVEAISSHHNYNEFVDQTRLLELIEMARIMGQKYIVCPGGVPNTAEGFRQAGPAFNRAGEQIRRAGMKLGYHNHTSEFEGKDSTGKSFYQILLDSSDAHLLHMELDIGWSTAAGEDAVQILNANKGRILLTHIKDLNAQGQLADVGTGVIDWARILEVATKDGVREFIIENDDQSDPRTDDRAANMHAYLDNLQY